MSTSTQNPSFSLDCYSTAVVIIPPPQIQTRVNSLRTGNDKSFPRWTAHFTMLFPFVSPDRLPQATEHLRDAISRSSLTPFSIQLDHTSSFSQRSYDTIYLAPSEKSHNSMQEAWKVISEAFRYKGRSFVPHMTLGQASHNNQSRQFLTSKGMRLIERGLEWTNGSVIILRKDNDEQGIMKIFATIPFTEDPADLPIAIAPIEPPTYKFESTVWQPAKLSSAVDTFPHLSVATYNVMYDPAYPLSKRIAGILTTIERAKADVLCLQEVTDECLTLLLSSEVIRNLYAFSSRGEFDAMENCRNIVILSRSHAEFSWQTLIIGAKQKPASLAHIRFKDGRSLAIASIHLSAGHFPDLEQRKLLEFQSLLEQLQSRFPASDVLIAGDSNFLNSTRLPRKCGADVWLATHTGSKDEGNIFDGTFEPSKNPLAAPPDRADRSAKRYDRMWLISNDQIRRLKLISSEVVGRDVDNASDHYLFLAHFEFQDVTPPSPVGPAQPSLSDLTLTGEIREGGALSDDRLQSYCSEIGFLPSEQDKVTRDEAIGVLRRCLSADPGRETPAGESSRSSQPSGLVLIVQPVGSFALGVYTPSSDIDCTVVGNIPPNTFWSFIKERVEQASNTMSDVIHIRRFIKDALVKVLELLINGIKMDVQYCCAPQVALRWHELATLPPKDSIFLLPASALRTLNAHRDTLAILSVLPHESLPAFQLAHRSLRAFCVMHGIFNSRVGYLGSIHLTILLIREALRQEPGCTTSQLILSFMRSYSRCQWETSEFLIPGVTDGNYARGPDEPMAILTINKPLRNAAGSATRSTVSVASREFSSAVTQLESGASWLQICGKWDGLESQVHRFLYEFPFYIKVSVSYWGRNALKGRSLFGYVESRIVWLLAELRPLVPHTFLRLWPARFSESDHASNTDLECIFLVGIDESLSTAALSLLRNFEGRLRSMERYYDPSVCYLSVSHVEKASVSSLKAQLSGDSLDDGYLSEESDSDLDSDVEEDRYTRPEREAPEPDPLWDPETFAFTKSISKSKHKKASRLKSPTPHVAAPKLRTSVDVYNRLMWDTASGDKGDFVIGYEDRFKGIKETGLLAWKREVEDMEFIPFHRVVYFRRQSDNTVLWDRRSKIDIVFGSGVSAEASL